MYPAERTQRRMMRQVLYSLKRLYGGSIDIYTINSSVTNQETGVTTLSKDIVHVDRAIVLPARKVKEIRKSISQISANKMFVVGGTYDAGRRIFILDRLDTPSLTLTNNSYLVYRDRKYEFESVEEFEFESAWVIIGRELVGEVPEQIHLLKADNLLQLEGGTNVS